MRYQPLASLVFTSSLVLPGILARGIDESGHDVSVVHAKVQVSHIGTSSKSSSSLKDSPSDDLSLSEILSSSSDDLSSNRGDKHGDDLHHYHRHDHKDKTYRGHRYPKHHQYNKDPRYSKDSIFNPEIPSRAVAKDILRGRTHPRNNDLAYVIELARAFLNEHKQDTDEAFSIWGTELANDESHYHHPERHHRSDASSADPEGEEERKSRKHRKHSSKRKYGSQVALHKRLKERATEPKAVYKRRLDTLE